MPAALTRAGGLALVAVTFAAAAAAQSASNSTAIEWRCLQQFDKSFHVHCVAMALPTDPAYREDAISAWQDVGSDQRGRDMRPVAERGDAAVFSNEPWLVPLHSRPTDPRFVGALLESVLCGRHAACTVRYEATSSRVAQR